MIFGGFRLTRGRAIGLGWIVFAIFYSLQSYTFHLSVGQPIQFQQFLMNEALFVGLLAVQTPIILALAARFPITGAQRGLHITLHAVAGLVLGFTHRFAFEAVARSMRATPEQPFQWERVFQAALGQFELGVFAYLVVLLAAAFWDYYSRYQAERLQAVHLRADLSAAQLETLRMQVQPHFLFNTLNAISILIEEEPRIARSMIEALSDFLRATLAEGSNQEIPLAREMELLRNYLRIEQTRFGDRLLVEVTMEEAAGKVAVPALLLQPLVENAIRHGLARRPGRSRLEIEASLSDGSLLLAVRDRAESDPLSPEANLSGTNGADNPGLGIGLRNTQARLESLYGDAQSLTLRRLDEGGGAGSEVRVRIPREPRR